ncbi:MAG TPA: GntR family transcriptional regulator [Candidatus Hydrogenedens sp.]|nr:GntR family transcriptional regulator [Candidatus Hydrogenedens sp.]
MIRIVHKGGIPIYAQIIQQFKSLIASGVLKPGDKLPSVRDIAKRHSVDVGTVKRAYRELRKEGFTFIRYGIGTFVTEPEVEDSYKDRKQILTEYIKILLDEMKNLKFSLPELIELIHECANSMNTSHDEVEEGKEASQETVPTPEQAPESNQESSCCCEQTAQETTPPSAGQDLESTQETTTQSPEQAPESTQESSCCCEQTTQETTFPIMEQGPDSK